MKVHCLPKTWLFSFLLAACCVSADIRSVDAADRPVLTHDRLKQLVKEAIDKGWIDYKRPSNQFDGDVLQVRDVSFSQGWDETSNSPDAYVAVFYQQAEIELRRRFLFKLAASRQVIEPYFQRMEKVVGQELAAIQDKSLNEDAFNAKMDELEPQINQQYEAGLTAVAKSVGKREFQFVNEGGLEAHEVKLVAAQGATIEIVPQTTAMIYKGAGATDDELPWISYQANETASLAGTYFCRIRLNGRQQTMTKKVGGSTASLEFPKP